MKSPIIDAIQSRDNTIYLSVASIWEIIIKARLGKIVIPNPPVEFLIQQRDLHHIRTIPVEDSDLMYLQNLPLLHRDPFDRILIAQCIRYNMSFATRDSAMGAYPVTLFPVD